MNKSIKKGISVIVPVYNDPYGLKDTLNCLVEQDFPKELFEIIVADNGSTDKTLSVINDFLKKYPKLIRMVQEKNIKSSYAARNKGIREAKGTVISFIDADMTVEKDWLKKVIESLKKSKTDCIVCDVKVIPGEKSIFALYDRMVAFPIEKYVKQTHYTPVGCLTIYKAIFKKTGFFDSKLISGGDHEFGNRLYEAGYKIHYEPDIVMNHPNRSSLKQLLKKAFRIGRGYKQIEFYYPDRYKTKYRNIFNPKYFFPIKSIVWFITSTRENQIWLKANPSEKYFFCIIRWSYLLTNFLGYTYERLLCLRKKALFKTNT